MEEIATSLLTKATVGGGQLALLVVVMWYMLKDLKKSVHTLQEKSPDTQLAVLADRYARLKDDHDKLQAMYHGKVEGIEKELSAVWRNIGSRPGDKT